MPGPDPELVDAILADPAGAVLASDVDGTLAPIVTHAADARADPGAVAALAGIAGRLGGVALITGRPVEVVLGMGDLAGVSGLQVFGHYGMEHWADGRLSAPPPDPALAWVRERLPELPDGVYVEEKGLSFVVHTRPASDPAGALEALDRPIRELAREAGLEVVDGSFAREVRPRGVDKGDVLKRFVGEASTVVYLGDDDGDLPAAAALCDLRSAGRRTTLVCAVRDGGSVELRDQADVLVDGIAGVVAWLTGLAAALSA